MILSRLRLTYFLVTVIWCCDASAQQTSTTGSSGASSAFGAPAANPATGAAPGIAPGNSTGFGGFGLGTGAATSGEAGPTSSTAFPSSSEVPATVKPADSGPTTFSISTGFGRAPEIFTAGEGRLTRPRFQTSVSASIGFDDNIFQTATKAEGTPDVVVRQQTTAGTPAQIVLVPIPNTQPTRIGGIKVAPPPQQYREVIIPAVEPEFQDIVIPGTPKPKRRVSAISRESVSFEAQTSTRRTVFTLDLNVNSDYYWNRPGKKAEYNGDLAIRYLHRFTPRLQATASVNASYLSQPDLSQINTPTNTGNGNYLILGFKSDLSYRWAPRFSTVTSFGVDTLSFEEKVRQIGDYLSFTIGNEFRFLWKPRATLVLEGRYSHISYPNNTNLDSGSYFGLVGIDFSVSRRAGATVRAGIEMKSFDETSNSSLAPYLETTLNYQLSAKSVLSLNNRFGFEEPPDANTQVLTFRTGLSVSHVFTPRFRGSLSINAIHRSTTNDTAGVDSTEDTLDSTLGFYYTLTQKWSFNLNYSYTTVFTDPGNGDYFRNRVFAGFDHPF